MTSCLLCRFVSHLCCGHGAHKTKNQVSVHEMRVAPWVYWGWELKGYVLPGLGNYGVGVAYRGWQGYVVPLKHPPLNCLGRHLFMDSGPSTLHLIILADPNTSLQKALILYKHAVCDTTQPISNAPGSHSRGCGYLLQACAQTCSSAPVSPRSVFPREQVWIRPLLS